MARMLTFVCHDDPSASRGDQDEIRVRYAKTLAAVRADFIGTERYRSIELANGFD
jgi:hypothetical protein